MQDMARDRSGNEMTVRVRLGDAVALTLGGSGSGSEDKRYIYSYR